MKKYDKQVKEIKEVNEEEINDDEKETNNEFFIKDQEMNERRKRIRANKLKKEYKRSKSFIN